MRNRRRSRTRSDPSNGLRRPAGDGDRRELKKINIPDSILTTKPSVFRWRDSPRFSSDFALIKSSSQVDSMLIGSAQSEGG